MPHATPSLKSTSSTPLLSMKVPETETAKWEQREGESERERPTQRPKDGVAWGIQIGNEVGRNMSNM